MLSITIFGTIPYMEPLLSFPHAALASVIPKPSKLALTLLPPSDETLEQRRSRIRRERGFTQVEISGNERGKLRLNADARRTSCRVLQSLERIEALPANVQTAVLKSLDPMLKIASPAKGREAIR